MANSPDVQIVFFIWVPGQAVDWAYALPILIGVLVTLVIGETLLLIARKSTNKV